MAFAGLLLLLAGRPAAAIDPHRPLAQSLQRIWQTQQGLPTTPITSLLQTTDGYLWLGTQRGLYRFDGIRFATPRTSADALLEDLWIQDLWQDEDHNLWIATDGEGLIRLRDGALTRYTTKSGLPSDDVRRVLVDRQRSVWVATAAGLARIDERAGAAITRLSSAPLTALCQTASGEVWAGGDQDELLHWNGRQLESRRLTSLAEHAAVNALLSTPDGSLWAGTSDGLVRLEGHAEHHFSEHRLTAADGLADDNVLCLAPGAGNVLWIGTRDGFSRLLAGEIESFDTRDGLSQSTVYSLCEDREGSLWVGTKHGLNQFLDRRTLLYTTREGLPSNDVGPVLQDSPGNIWVGTLGAGLGRFDGRRFATLTTADGLASNTVYTLADGGDGRLWVGTAAGLNLLVDGRVESTFSVDDGLPSAEVFCLCRDQAGTLWVGTSAGLARSEGNRFVQPRGEPGALRLPIKAVVAHGDGGLVAAAQGGILLRCVDGECTPFEAGKLDHWNVDTFLEDADGRLWMGTQGHGLLLVTDDHQTFRFTTKDGLYDDDIFGIAIDNRDRLWMACSKGIFFVERHALRQFAAGQIKSLTNTPFTPMDALRTIECRSGIQPSVWKLQDGSVWFSTIRGLIVLDPARLQRVLPPVPVVVEDVVVNGRSQSPEQLSRLSPDQTNLEFRYTALSLVTPTRTTFRYQLAGFDKDWVEAGSRREAFYTNLPPGHYRFEVAARLQDGKWEPAARAVKFTIEPHFYQASWFLPLCAGALLLTFWGAYRLRVRRIKQRLQLVVAERSRIARELHDTLMQGFSGVTMEMQALSARLAPSPERRTLEEIIRDAGACLREARRSVAGLRNSRGDETGLSAAIAEAARQLTETHDIRLKLDLERNPAALPDDVQYNLLRIAQEAVSNAVKHSGCRTIAVGLDCSAERLRLSVQDDGVGLDTPEGPLLRPGHYGLIGMRERAGAIGAELHVSSHPGQGTTVRVELPIAGAAVAAPLSNLPPRTPSLER